MWWLPCTFGLFGDNNCCCCKWLWWIAWIAFVVDDDCKGKSILPVNDDGAVIGDTFVFCCWLLAAFKLEKSIKCWYDK